MGGGKAGNDIEWEAKGRFALLVKKEGERMKREEKEEQMKMYSVILGDNKKHLKAVLLSDLHIGTFVDQKQTRKIVEAGNKIGADFVVIAGDTFDEGAFAHCARAEISQELQKMCPKGQVYAALGNHDPSSNDPDVRTFFQEAAEKGQIWCYALIHIKDSFSGNGFYEAGLWETRILWIWKRRKYAEYCISRSNIVNKKPSKECKTPPMVARLLTGLFLFSSW